MTTLHSSFIRAPECKCRHKNDEIPSQPEHLSLSLRLPYLDILKKLLSSAAGRRRTWRRSPTEWHSDDCCICTTQAPFSQAHTHLTQQVQFTELLDVQIVATGHTHTRTQGDGACPNTRVYYTFQKQHTEQQTDEFSCRTCFCPAEPSSAKTISVNLTNHCPLIFNYSIFWSIMQRRLVTHRRFGTTYRCHLQWVKRDTSPLKMGPIGCPETSMLNHPKQHNNPKDGRVQVNRIGSLRSCTDQLYCLVSQPVI
jgi:hypothetical protein